MCAWERREVKVPNCRSYLSLLICVHVCSDEASGGATRAPAPPTAMIYMEPGLSPGYRHEEEEEGKEGLEEAGGRRRGSQPWLRRFLASSLHACIITRTFRFWRRISLRGIINCSLNSSSCTRVEYLSSLNHSISMLRVVYLSAVMHVAFL